MFDMGIHVVPVGTCIMGDGSVIAPRHVTPEDRANARHIISDLSMIVGTSSIWVSPRKKEELDHAIRRNFRARSRRG